MPVVCDYTMINKRLGTTNPKTGKIEEQIFGSWDHPFVIGDAGGGATFGKDRFEVEFRTAAMEHAPALLSLMVRGISTNHPQTDNPEDKGSRVAILSEFTNRERGTTIGRLLPAPDGMWRQEQFQIPTNTLSPDKPNKLIIGRVDLPGAGEAHDEFEV